MGSSAQRGTSSGRSAEEGQTRLIAAARAACRRSAALGSRPPRGAAILTPGGRLFSGAEISNPQHSGVQCCAERAALYQALMAGQRRFRALTVRAGGNGRSDGGPPCGTCLQALIEFSPRLRVHWGTDKKPQGGGMVQDLLPGPFRGAHLRKAGP